MARTGAELTGVELDPTTAAIAQALYPDAEIRAESFADTRYPAGHFDAVLGNVPFADVVLHDPRYNGHKLTMHNHFIAKSLELTRHGGLVAVLTSRYTMDATNPAARRVFSNMADLVGAVRLPTGAHRRAAGTEAVTDLLIFRRRESDLAPRSEEWVYTEPVPMTGPDGQTQTVPLNQYWRSHPDMVLGQVELAVSMHGVAGIQVMSPDPAAAAEHLQSALGKVVAAASAAQLRMTPRTEEQRQQAAGYVPAHEAAIDGEVLTQSDGTFAVVDDGQLTPLRVPKTQTTELRALLQLRDEARTLIEAEAVQRDDTPELEQLRSDLLTHWRSYVAEYGPINRSSRRPTGRLNPETGEPVMARVSPPVMRHLRADP